MSLDLSVSLTSSVAMPSSTSDLRVWWLHTRNTSLLNGVTILLRQTVSLKCAMHWYFGVTKTVVFCLFSLRIWCQKGPRRVQLPGLFTTVSSSVTFHWFTLFFGRILVICYYLKNNLQNENKGGLMSSSTTWLPASSFLSVYFCLYQTAAVWRFFRKTHFTG